MRTESPASQYNLALLCCLCMAASGTLPLIIQSQAAFFASALRVGFFESYVVIAAWTLRQTTVPAAVLGRVTGITSTLFKVSMVVGIPLAGLLSEHFSSALGILFGIGIALLGIIPMAISLAQDLLRPIRSEGTAPD